MDIDDSEVQQLFDDKTYVRQIMAELQSFRDKLYEQQQLNVQLEVQLAQASSIQMTTQQLLNGMEQQIQEQFDEVSELRKQMYSKKAEYGIVSAKNSTPQSDTAQSDSEESMDGESLEVENIQTQQCDQRIVIQHSEERAQDSDQSQSQSRPKCPKVNSKQLKGSSGKNQVRGSKGKGEENNAEPLFRGVEAGNSSRETRDASQFINRKRTGFKSHNCKECDRSFSSKQILANHLRTHTGEKPFKCRICDRSFSQKSHLTRHFRTHTGEQPYVCRICDRSFGDKSNFSRHLRTHTGEKPFRCDICNHSCRHKSNLAKHMKIHADEIDGT